MLRGARGLFDASDFVTREEFAAYVSALLAGADFAGLRSMAYAPLIDGSAAAAHVATQRASGVPDYAIFPPACASRWRR